MLACWQLNEGLARQLRELVYYIIYHYSKLCYIKHISISIIIICISIVNIIIRITICSIIIISISISTPQERPQAKRRRQVQTPTPYPPPSTVDSYLVQQPWPTEALELQPVRKWE